MTLKVGDRVRVYGHLALGWKPACGKVVSVSEGASAWGFITIRTPDGCDIGAHPKQCRKLKPKPKVPRACCVKWPEDRTAPSEVLAYPFEGFVEFREVLP